MSATISFAAANGTLSGAGLSAGVVSDGTVTYSLSATTAASLQAELRAAHIHAQHRARTGDRNHGVRSDGERRDGVAADNAGGDAVERDDNPDVVATDAAGDVFVANKEQHGEEFSQRRRALADAVERDPTSPKSVATDAAGDVFVANDANRGGGILAAGALVQTLSNGNDNPLRAWR